MFYITVNCHIPFGFNVNVNPSFASCRNLTPPLPKDISFHIFTFRNNKLTLLMQDSLGGDSKTLMFVNISPSLYNLDETIVSLTYASRVKQVTNGATRNSESKEVARLRSVSTLTYNT